MNKTNEVSEQVNRVREEKEAKEILDAKSCSFFGSRTHPCETIQYLELPRMCLRREFQAEIAVSQD